MGNDREKTVSGKKSRKTSKRKKKPPAFVGNQNNVASPATRNDTLPKLGGGGMEKMPSNAPTMAIAPSDYEHIFHEGAGQAEKTNAAIATNVAQTNANSPATPPTMNSVSPPPPSPQANQYATTNEAAPTRTRLPEPEIQYPTYGGPRPQYATAEVQATPDGYTLLGHAPDTSQNRVALPPYIVRASNQFSRAALARVAMYLATRADPSDRYR